MPIPTDEAVAEVEKRLLGVETNIENWQRKQNERNNFATIIPYNMEQQRRESKEFLDDLTVRDQRMMLCLLTIVHIADSKEQLDNDTEGLQSAARKHLCQLSPLKLRQGNGLDIALPYGLRRISNLRTLTTESLAVLMPFRAQEVAHEGGTYKGINVISKNPIFVSRKTLLNGNAFILGVSGAGKSFTAKEDMISLYLSDPNVDVIIIDPEREYSPLTQALYGETIRVSPNSFQHINAMDINEEYGEGVNPIAAKSEFMLALCEQVMGSGVRGQSALGAKQKSIIDRCTARVYKYYVHNGFVGKPPTLKGFYTMLMQQKEQEAKDVALAIELFTDGSLNTFAKQTNVDINNRLICYDTLDLGKQLQSIGMLVVLDNILNRITKTARQAAQLIFS